jgi:hypothetical protein
MQPGAKRAQSAMQPPTPNSPSPKVKKPRQDEPTGVDGGQIALAIGFGAESSMSLSPRCKRLHLKVAGRRSQRLERDLFGRRCESSRNATEGYAWAHQESSLGIVFRDEYL